MFISAFSIVYVDHVVYVYKVFNTSRPTNITFFIKGFNILLSIENVKYPFLMRLFRKLSKLLWQLK